MVFSRFSSKTIVSAFLLMAAHGFGQGVITITFDGSPAQPPDSAFSVTQYYEAGMSFTPIAGSDGFARANNTTGNPLWPNNGTTYLQAPIGYSLTGQFINNSPFNLLSVDLAGYSTVVPNGTADFYGFQTDGSIVQTSFSFSGLNFHTYYFGPEWNNLVRVDVPYFGSLDNLRVSPVPEPSTFALALLGLGVFAFARRRTLH